MGGTCLELVPPDGRPSTSPAKVRCRRPSAPTLSSTASTSSKFRSQTRPALHHGWLISMELKRELFTAEMVEPRTGEIVKTPVEVRFDPLTGHSSRILPERGLMPAKDFDLEAFARE